VRHHLRPPARARTHTHTHTHNLWSAKMGEEAGDGGARAEQVEAARAILTTFPTTSEASAAWEAGKDAAVAEMRGLGVAVTTADAVRPPDCSWEADASDTIWEKAADLVTAQLIDATVDWVLSETLTELHGEATELVGASSNAGGIANTATGLGRWSFARSLVKSLRS
jgi:hypothetical protein